MNDEEKKVTEEETDCPCGSGLEERYCCGEKEAQIGCKCKDGICTCTGPQK